MNMPVQDWSHGCPRCGSQHITYPTWGGYQRYCCDCDLCGCHGFPKEPEPARVTRSISPEEFSALINKERALLEAQEILQERRSDDAI